MALRPHDLNFSPLHLGSSCTRIDGAHNRAILVRQLQRLRDFILSHADRTGMLPWIDLSPPQYSATSGQTLNAHKINLYQAAHGPTLH